MLPSFEIEPRFSLTSNEVDFLIGDAVYNMLFTDKWEHTYNIGGWITISKDTVKIDGDNTVYILINTGFPHIFTERISTTSFFRWTSDCHVNAFLRDALTNDIGKEFIRRLIGTVRATANSFAIG